MSYCSMSEGDVYLIASREYWECICCRFRHDGDDERFRNRTETLTHLEKHQRAGHSVPQRAFDRLRAEIEAGRE